MAAKAAGMPIDDNYKEDVFELQHHHLLRCLEKTTVSKDFISPYFMQYILFISVVFTVNLPKFFTGFDKKVRPYLDSTYLGSDHLCLLSK